MIIPHDFNGNPYTLTASPSALGFPISDFKSPFSNLPSLGRTGVSVCNKFFNTATPILTLHGHAVYLYGMSDITSRKAARCPAMRWYWYPKGNPFKNWCRVIWPEQRLRVVSL